jgi:RNA polymerase sigma-70 factor (ECF subfamily)
LREDGLTASSESLLLRFGRSRAEAAFRLLYDATAPGMFGFALRLTGGDRAEAEDIVQEAWFRAVDRIDRYAAPGSAERWLNGFVLNCWRERRRDLARELQPMAGELEQSSDVNARPWSEAPLLERAVARLPEGFRAVLVLHDIEGFTHAEIGERLGIETGTSKSQLSRARRALRLLLSRQGGVSRAQGNSNDR